MAITTSVIKSSLGDYTTLTLWEAALPADPAVGDGATASIEEAAFDANSAAALAFNVSNANGADYLITVAATYRFRDQTGWPSCVDVEGAGAFLTATTTITTSNLTIEFLEITTGDTSVCINFATSSGCIVRYSMFHDCGGFMAINESYTCTMHHCVGYNGNATLAAIYANGNLNIYNCTFVKGDGTAANGLGKRGYARNCTLLGFDTCYAALCDNSSAYNMASDTSNNQFTVGAQMKDVSITYLRDTGSTAMDLRPAVAYGGGYEGGDYSATVGSVDISGNDYSGKFPPIGAFYTGGVNWSKIASADSHYTTLALWEASLTADVAVGDGETGSIEEAMDVGPVDVDISNANSAQYLITVAEAYRFNQATGWPSCSAVELLGAYITSAGTTYPIRTDTPHLTVEYLEITSTSTRPCIYLLSSGTDLTVRYCMLREGASHAISGTRGGDLIHDNFIYGMGSHGIFPAAGTCGIYNNTILNCVGTGIIGTAGTPTVTNNICVGNGTDYTGTPTGTLNLSSDATAPGTSPWINVTPADVLENVTGGSEDLHLSDLGNGERYLGTDESATIGDYDIDNNLVKWFHIGAASPDILKSIIASTASNYTTLTLWEASLVVDAPAGTTQTGSIEESYNCNAGGKLTMDVSNANSAPILITVAEAYRFNQQTGWPNVAAVEGLGAHMDNGINDGISVATTETTIEWLEVYGDEVANKHGVYTAGAVVFNISRCIVHHFDSCVRFVTSGAVSIADNCFAYKTGQVTGNDQLFACANGTATWYNCTAFSASGAAHGFERVSGTATAYNCISVGNADNWNGTIGGDYNMSSSTDAPGANSFQSVAAADVLANVTLGTEDLHMKTGLWIYRGSDESATIGSLDIDGNTRAWWDIGADEVMGIRVFSIKSSLGDYTTLALWEASLPDDMDSSSGATASIEEAMDVGRLTFDVSNANGAPFLVTVVEAYRFNQQAGWPNMAAVEGLGARAVAGHTGADHAIDSISTDLTVEWMELKGFDNGLLGTQLGSDRFTIQNCMMHWPEVGKFAVFQHGECNVYNVAAYEDVPGGSTRAGFLWTGATVTGKCINLTCRTGNYYGVQANSGAVITAYNNVVMGASRQDYNGAITGDWNVSGNVEAIASTNVNDSSTAWLIGTTYDKLDLVTNGGETYVSRVGSNLANTPSGDTAFWTQLTSRAMTDVVANVTPGSEDLHLAVGAGVKFLGSDQTAITGTKDIDNETRVTFFNIGADEYVAPAPSGSAALGFMPVVA